MLALPQSQSKEHPIKYVAREQDLRAKNTKGASFFSAVCRDSRSAVGLESFLSLRNAPTIVFGRLDPLCRTIYALGGGTSTVPEPGRRVLGYGKP